MYCRNCGSEMPDGAMFCGKCGAAAPGTETVDKMGGGLDSLKSRRHGHAGTAADGLDSLKSMLHGQQGQEERYMEPSAYSNVFVDPDEQLLATLGNGYLENMTFFSRIKKAHALLTDKRVYFQGAYFKKPGGVKLKHSYTINREQIVNLEDITGTGFLYYRPIGALIVLLLVIAAWIAAWITSIGLYGNIPVIALIIGTIVIILTTIVRYILGRKVFFRIEYAGNEGEILCDAKIIGLAAVRDFQKQIRRAKDRLKEKA